MTMAYYLLWDYWYYNGSYYAVYELENKLYFSEANLDSIAKLIKKKPNIFSKDWLKKLFKRNKEE